MGSRSHAPPQLIILLWHHCCYYKRHYITLLFTILLPFMFLLPLYFLIRAMTDGSIDRLEVWSDSATCKHQTKVPLSAGPLQFITYKSCVQEAQSNYGEDSNHSGVYKRWKAYRPVNQYCMNPQAYSDGSILESILLNQYLPKCIDVKLIRNDEPDCPIKLKSTDYFCHSHSLYASTFMKLDCTLFKGIILYYPENPATQRVMDHVLNKLKNYESVMKGSGNLLGLRTIPVAITKALTEASKYTRCFNNMNRVRGFTSREEATLFAQNISRQASQNISRQASQNISDEDHRQISSNFDPLASLWGIVGFDGLAVDAKTLPKMVKYRIIRDRFSKSPLDVWLSLQDLVEEAILKSQSGLAQLPLSITFKPTPDKCWIRPARFLYSNTLSYIVPFLAVFSFLLSPVNFLEQVVTEKWLRLREYMYIMGVGAMTLKVSWILFYLIFLAPLSFAFGLFLVYLPGGVLARSDPSLIFLLLLLYNICQLAFCYLLATILQKPRRSGTLLAFIHSLFWLLACFLFTKLDFMGTTLVLARSSCLYCVVPLVIGICYILAWEKWWIGASWNNLCFSPLITDQFGGLGECFIWLIFDTILYLVLAWYIEKVAPGDFGVKHPPWFLFQPDYWFPKRFRKMDYEHLANVDADVEYPGDQVPRGIEIQALTKAYTRSKIGISKLSLTFYANEVTAFLGQNGAGKSTTLNILCGLISATEGSAQISGFDIQNQMEEIRKILGFVPQYDILYPNMTVDEHLQFFGWLKGLSKVEIGDVVGNLLKKMGLENHKRNITTTLSGGQKRKLSVLTAYLGKPEMIILDEPTSGVDPFSRRMIWDLILANRRSATTVLSTHHMEEADFLGDRVAIISAGILRAFGTPMYLKNRYGHGFRLTIACNPENDRAHDAVKEFLVKEVPSSQLVKEAGKDLSFSLPLELARSKEISRILTELEEKQQALGIASYGISEPTMEEVFFSASQKTMKKSTPLSIDGERHRGVMASGPEHMTLSEGSHLRSENQAVASDRHFISESGLDGNSTGILYTKLTGCQLLIVQSVAFFRKRLQYTIRSVIGALLQIVLPLAFIILLLLIGNNVTSSLHGSTQVVNAWAKYRDNVLFYQDSNSSGGELGKQFIKPAVLYGFAPRCPKGIGRFGCDGSLKESDFEQLAKDPGQVAADADCNCLNFCRKPDSSERLPSIRLPSGDWLYNFGVMNDITDWLIYLNRTSHLVIGGFQFRELSNSSLNSILEQLPLDLWTIIDQSTPRNYAVVWTHPDLELAMLNMFNNVLLRGLSNGDSEYSITVSLETATLTVEELTRVQYSVAETFNVLVGSSFIYLAFGFSLFGIAVFIQYENSTGLKRLQFMAGGNKVVYWTVNFIWDYLQYLVTVALIILLLGTVENSFKGHVGKIAAVALPFGFQAIAFTYLFSLLFASSGGIIRLQIISVFIASQLTSTFCIFALVYEMCQARGLDDCQFGWSVTLNTILDFYPFYFLTDGCVLVAFAALFDFGSGPNPFANIYSMTFLGKRVLIAMFSGLVYFGLLMYLEFIDFQAHPTCGGWCKKGNRDGLSYSRMPFEDPDVIAEANRVLRDDCHDPLVVREVVKRYLHSMVPAVNKVSFGVQKAQCFGLLGINGAGKTTLFRILTGFLKPSSGTATLKGRNLFKFSEMRNVHQEMGYCPQENVVFDNLTAKEQLSLFAALHGVPWNHAKRLIKLLIMEVRLKDHVKKLASELSGGNQRKLQFALALIGYKSTIFLDEPTTGMDPGARKDAWECIRRAIDVKGCSVVLTSHSMDECEALCDRLVIMVCGQLRCIGSVQYLKDKFGNQYTFKLKVAQSSSNDKYGDDSQTTIVEIKEFLKRKFVQAILVEQRSSILSYKIPATGLRLSTLFEVLSGMKELFPVEDFTVSQTTLEHVFVNMAQVQEMLQYGLAVTFGTDGQIVAGESDTLPPNISRL